MLVPPLRWPMGRNLTQVHSQIWSTFDRRPLSDRDGIKNVKKFIVS